MAANPLDKLARTANGGIPAVATVQASRTTGVTTLSVDTQQYWPTVSGIKLSTYKVDTSGNKVAGSQTDWEGVSNGTNSISGLVRTGGAIDSGNAVGDKVQMGPTAQWGDDFVAAMSAEHSQVDGKHTNITATSVTATGTVTAASFVQTGGASGTDWNVGLPAPSTVTYNGNRSYSLVFNGSDLTGTINPGTRLRTTRTVAAPTQCTSLNGTTQYYSKTSPAGMTFTNNFVVSAWVKLTSYPATDSGIVSRFNGTSGWILVAKTTGQISLQGYNAGGANFSTVTSYQSIPLNKWVHVSAQLDMLTFTATPTTSYVMIDGVDVPATVARGGTNPTALVQAGNLEIGSFNGGTNLFPGKVAQAAIFSAKVTQATIQSYTSQGLAGTETSLISAYSFNNSINDLNVSNANNLTANGSAVATNAASPFGGQASGAISSTLDYAIVQSVAFSTNTTVVVQVPEGCTIPTSGGVSAVVYSSNKAPYGMPIQGEKWVITCMQAVNATQSSTTSGVWYNIGSAQLTVPTGSWRLYNKHSVEIALASSGFTAYKSTLSSSASAQTNSEFTIFQYGSSSATAFLGSGLATGSLSFSSATVMYALLASNGVAALTMITQGAISPTIIYAENSLL